LKNYLRQCAPTSRRNVDGIIISRNRPGAETGLAAVGGGEDGGQAMAGPSLGLALDLKAASSKGSRIESALDKLGLQKRKVSSSAYICTLSINGF
jgi:hypothetical protein